MPSRVLTEQQVPELTEEQRVLRKRKKTEIAQLDKEVPWYIPQRGEGELWEMSPEQICNLRTKLTTPYRQRMEQFKKVQLQLDQQMPGSGERYVVWQAKANELGPWLNAAHKRGLKPHSIFPAVTNGFVTIVAEPVYANRGPAKTRDAEAVTEETEG